MQPPGLLGWLREAAILASRFESARELRAAVPGRGNQLEGHFPAEARVARSIDVAHATGAEGCHVSRMRPVLRRQSRRKAFRSNQVTSLLRVNPEL
jgi:hypothetical protein